MYNKGCRDRAFGDANDYYYVAYMYSVSVREFNPGKQSWWTCKSLLLLLFLLSKYIDIVCRAFMSCHCYGGWGVVPDVRLQLRLSRPAVFATCRLSLSHRYFLFSLYSSVTLFYRLAFPTFLVRIMVMYGDIKKERGFVSSSRFLIPCVTSSSPYRARWWKPLFPLRWRV